MENIQFEAIKTGLKQSKDGYMLSLAVHPDELSEDLMRDFVGSRYVVVMVRIGDNEEPLDRKELRKHHPAVAMAGMLCRDRLFWEYIDMRCNENVMTEGECTEWLKYFFEIDSRAELKSNEKAREAFLKFKEEFDEWKK
jgi:hypothetical protein